MLFPESSQLLLLSEMFYQCFPVDISARSWSPPTPSLSDTSQLARLLGAMGMMAVRPLFITRGLIEFYAQSQVESRNVRIKLSHWKILGSFFTL